MNLAGEFRLALQRPGPHYALVRIFLAPSSDRSVVVADDAWDWLAKDYGPDYRTGPTMAAYEAEAVGGAAYALAEADSSAAVTIREIRCAPADTAADDVRFAAAWAVWDALDHHPDRSPWIDDAGVHFPESGTLGSETAR